MTISCRLEWFPLDAYNACKREQQVDWNQDLPGCFLIKFAFWHVDKLRQDLGACNKHQQLSVADSSLLMSYAVEKFEPA